MIPGKTPVAMVASIRMRRSMTGSMMKYSPKPPMTPETTRWSRERYSFLCIGAVYRRLWKSGILLKKSHQLQLLCTCFLVLEASLSAYTYIDETILGVDRPKGKT